MGVLPLVFNDDQGWDELGLTGFETYTIEGMEKITPRKVLTVRAVKEDATEVLFQVTARLDTEVDVAYFEHGGILPYVLRQILK